MMVRASICFGDLDNPDEVLSVAFPLHNDVFGSKRLWPQVCRGFGLRLRQAVAKRAATDG